MRRSAVTPAVRAIAVAAVALLLASGCHPQLRSPTLTEPTLELALDEGRSAERPLTPPPTFEVLMRFDPHIDAYRVDRLRFLLAQPGHVTLTLYLTDDVGRPGKVLRTIDRVYEPAMSSGAGDGKWVVEELPGTPPVRGPLWVGISCPEKHSDPRLWATSNDSGNVFQRDADVLLTLDQLRIRRTPQLRVTITPAAASAPTSAATR